METAVRRGRVFGEGNRASYSWERHGNVVAIVDEWTAAIPRRSVTNDAENVIANLANWPGALAPGRRIVYRDTDKRWDEITIDNACRFLGFSRIGVETLEEAIAAVTKEEPDHGADAAS